MKHYLPHYAHDTCRSPPTRGRGLKPDVQDGADEIGGRPPRGGVG